MITVPMEPPLFIQSAYYRQNIQDVHLLVMTLSTTTAARDIHCRIKFGLNQIGDERAKCSPRYVVPSDLYTDIYGERLGSHFCTKIRIWYTWLGELQAPSH